MRSLPGLQTAPRGTGTLSFSLRRRKKKSSAVVSDGRHTISNVEKITSAILPLASNILFPPLPFRLFSNLFSVTMLALLLRISSKIAQKCRYKIVEFILSTLLKRGKTHCLAPFYLIGYQNDAKCRSIDLLAAYAVVQPASAFGFSIKHRGMVLQTIE